MAHDFNINAKLKVTGPANLGSIVAGIKSKLAGVKANISLGLSPGTITNVGNLNSRLATLNKNIIAVNKSGADLTNTMRQLGAAFAAMRNDATSVSGSLSKVVRSLKGVGQGARETKSLMFQLGEQIGFSTKRFLTFSIAAAAVATLAIATKEGFVQAAKFQQQLVKIQQVGGDSSATIKSISKEISRLSTTLGSSSSGLVEVASTLRQAGLSALDTKKALEALAKTELAPSFDNIKKTTEGAIAVMAQFKHSAKDLESDLGMINSVSAAYAVESADLIEAVKRSGGAFHAAGGELKQFLGLFTSVRATTRESAESISTAFRTIFARLEKPETLANLKKSLNVDLTTDKGQFIGPYEAIKKISGAIRDLPTTDPKFAKLVEEIGGIRNISKVIPLLKEFSLAEAAMNVGIAGTNSLTRDSITAQGALIIKVQKLKEEFLDLFRVISENEAFQVFVSGALTLASALIKITKTLEPLIPLFGALAAVKIGQVLRGGILGSVASGFARPVGHASGGVIKGFARGGTVPGHGSGDTVPAMLQPGEFVLRRSAARAIGHNTLQGWNHYAEGGNVLDRMQGYKGNTRLGSRLLLRAMSLSSPEIKQRLAATLPEDAEFLAAGTQALALRSPASGNVHRLALMAQRGLLGKKMIRNYAGRPVADDILQPLNSQNIGRFSVEELPFVPPIRNTVASLARRRKIIFAFQKRLLSQGKIPTDVTPDNIARHQGRIIGIDPDVYKIPQESSDFDLLNHYRNQAGLVSPNASTVRHLRRGFARGGFVEPEGFRKHLGNIGLGDLDLRQLVRGIGYGRIQQGGLFYPKQRKIIVKQDMPDEHKSSLLFHELVHAMDFTGSRLGTRTSVLNSSTPGHPLNMLARLANQRQSDDFRLDFYQNKRFSGIPVRSSKHSPFTYGVNHEHLAFGLQDYFDHANNLSPAGVYGGDEDFFHQVRNQFTPFARQFTRKGYASGGMVSAQMRKMIDNVGLKGLNIASFISKVHNVDQVGGNLNAKAGFFPRDRSIELGMTDEDDKTRASTYFHELVHGMDFYGSDRKTGNFLNYSNMKGHPLEKLALQSKKSMKWFQLGGYHKGTLPNLNHEYLAYAVQDYFNKKNDIGNASWQPKFQRKKIDALHKSIEENFLPFANDMFAKDMAVKPQRTKSVGTKNPWAGTGWGGFAAGGPAMGTDVVPAMLTPGEFVINRKSAQAIGYQNLHRVNKFAAGGAVGDSSPLPQNPSGFKQTTTMALVQHMNAQGVSPADISKFFDKVLDAVAKQIRTVSPSLSKREALNRATVTLRDPDTVVLVDKSTKKFVGTLDQLELQNKKLKASAEKVMRAYEKQVKEIEQSIKRSSAASGMSPADIRAHAERFASESATGGEETPLYGFNAPPMGPATPGRMRRKIAQLKSSRLGMKVGQYGSLAGFLAPVASEYLTGSAEKPGAFGTTGAGIGSVLGGAGAGAALGLQTGSPWGALIGAVVGAGAALLNFKKELEGVELDKFKERIDTALGAVDSKTNVPTPMFANAAKELGEQAKNIRKNSEGFSYVDYAREVGNSAVSSQTFGLYRDAFGHGDRSGDADKEIKDKLGPGLLKGLDAFKGFAGQNPTKNFDQLLKSDKTGGFTAILETLRKVDYQLYRETKNYINAIAKGNDTQLKANIALGLLGKSAEEMSEKVQKTSDILEKNFARGEVGRGGISGGVDFLKANALGQQGVALHEFGRAGGQSEAAQTTLRNALGEALKDNNPQNFEANVEKGLTGPGFAGEIGNALKLAILAKIDAEGEGVVKDKAAHNINSAADDLLKGTLGGITDAYNKINSELDKLGKIFGDSAVKIASRIDENLAEQERYKQVGISGRRSLALSSAQNLQGFAMDRRGNVTTPQDVRANINSGFAGESFAASQERFQVKGNSVDADNIATQLKGEKNRLESLKKGALQQQNNPPANGKIHDYFTDIANSTLAVQNLKSALQNLATSTTRLDAAQEKLNLALEKEAGDIAGRKQTAEQFTFGSRGDRMKTIMADQLTNVALGQGHLENFSDEQRAMVHGHLQANAGVVHSSGLTGQQIIEFLSGQNMQPSNMRTVGRGRNARSAEVAGAQNEVQAVQSQMQKAADALGAIAKADIAGQIQEHVIGFGNSLQLLQSTIEDFVKKLQSLEGNPAKKLAAGGMVYASSGQFVPRGSDTVPAMLTPGEFVVNKHAAAKNKGKLLAMNSGGVAYLAEGGGITYTDYIDSQGKQQRGPLDAQARKYLQSTITRLNKNAANYNQYVPDRIGSNGEDLNKSWDYISTFNDVPKPISPVKKQSDPKLVEQAKRDRAKMIAKRVANRQKLGLPEYRTAASRPDTQNAFSDSDANSDFNDGGHSTSTQRRLGGVNQYGMRPTIGTNHPNGFQNAGRSRSSYKGTGFQNISPSAISLSGGGNAGPSGGAAELNKSLENSVQQLAATSKPLIEALNSFPRELKITREGKVEVILNGAEVIAKLKGDLEAEVWKQIIDKIQEEVPKIVKNMPQA